MGIVMDDEGIKMNPDIMTAILHEVVDINTKITGYESRIKSMENDLVSIKVQHELLMTKKGFIKKLFGG